MRRVRSEEEKVLGWAGLCGDCSSVTDCEAVDEGKGTLGPCSLGPGVGLVAQTAGSVDAARRMVL